MTRADMLGRTVQPQSLIVSWGNPYRMTKAAINTGTITADTHLVGPSSRSSWDGE
jgi:hypothetical protein